MSWALWNGSWNCNGCWEGETLGTVHVTDVENASSRFEEAFKPVPLPQLAERRMPRKGVGCIKIVEDRRGFGKTGSKMLRRSVLNVTYGALRNVGEDRKVLIVDVVRCKPVRRGDARQTNQFGSSPLANPTAGGYSPMSFGIPQYENFGFNPGMPNFGYGCNGGFPYTPYLSLGGIDNTNNSGSNGSGGSGSNNSSHNRNGGNNNGRNGHGGNNNNGGNLNGNSPSNGPSVFQFLDTSLQHLKYEGYTDPFEHLVLFLNNVEQRRFRNEIAIKQQSFSTLRGIALQWDIKESTEETVQNYDGRLQVLVAKLKGSNPVPPMALMNYFVDGLLPNYCEKIKLHPMRSYEQVHDLTFKYENQVEIEGDPTQRYYVGRDPACWNINRVDLKPKETPKSKEGETI
eukprot:Gb_04262 [translate_table: standard]